MGDSQILEIINNLGGFTALLAALGFSGRWVAKWLVPKIIETLEQQRADFMKELSKQRRDFEDALEEQRKHEDKRHEFMLQKMERLTDAVEALTKKIGDSKGI